MNIEDFRGIESQGYDWNASYDFKKEFWTAWIEKDKIKSMVGNANTIAELWVIFKNKLVENGLLD